MASDRRTGRTRTPRTRRASAIRSPPVRSPAAAAHASAASSLRTITARFRPPTRPATSSRPGRTARRPLSPADRPVSGTGLTTAQLQGALPSGFSRAVWGTGGGLYPYLTNLYPTGVVAISGFGQDQTGAPTGGAGVDLFSGGGQIGETTYTGANGYYYEAFSTPQEVAPNLAIAAVLTPSGPSPVGGLVYADHLALNGYVVSLPVVRAGVASLNTADTTLSALSSDLNANFGDDGFPNLQGGTTPTTFVITASGGFNIDVTPMIPGPLSVVTKAGDLTVSGALAEQGTNSLTLVSAHNLTIAAPITSAAQVTLDAGGWIVESGAGAITAPSLGGIANGYVTLNGANQIASVSGFTNAGSGGFGLTDSGLLTISGALNAGSGALSLKGTTSDGFVFNAPVTAGGAASLQSQGSITFYAPLTIGGPLQMYAFGGAITEGAGGVLSAPSLSGGGQGLSLTNGANMIGALNGFGRTGASDTISLTDGEALTIGGAVSAGTGTISINAPGVIVNAPMTAGGLLQISSTQSISISASLTTGGNVSLTDHGLLTELGSGLIWSVGLTANSTGAEALIGANHVSQILGISTNGAVNFNDIVRLEVDGPISVGTGNLTLTGTTTGGIYLDAPVTVAGSGTFSTPGGIVFNSSAAFGGALSVTSTTYGVSEGPAGTISAPSLTGSAVAGLDLMGANQIGSIAGYTTPGNFNFTDSTALQVTGALTASGEITLISGGNLVVAAPVSAPSTITLTSGGEITEPTPGQITTHTIYVKAKTGVDLTGPNVIVSVGGDSTVSGPNVINR
jgi:hypothetical protein